MKIFNINPQNVYLNKNSFKTEKTKTINFTSAADTLIHEVSEKTVDMAEKNLSAANINRLLDIFKKNAEEAPKNLNLKISPSNGKIMGFSLNLDNGNTLEAIKSCVHKFCKNFFFITVKEFDNEKLKHSFAIDLESQGFVKLSRAGKSKVSDGEFIEVQAESADGKRFSERLSGYIKDIFSLNDKKSAYNPEILKTKSSAKKTTENKITIDDLLDEDKILELPEVEDIEINAQKKDKKNEKSLAKVKAKKVLTQKITKTPAPKIEKTRTEPKETKPQNPTPNAVPYIFTQPIQSEYNKLNTEGMKTASIKPQIVSKVRTSKRINNATAGKISDSTAHEIELIETLLCSIIRFLDFRKGNFPKIKALKTNYEPLVYQPAKRQKVTTFRLEDGATIGVIHTKISPHFTRIIYTDKDKAETHLLIEDREKVVSNLNDKKPWVVPVKFRYMTQEQIDKINLDKYTSFLKDELERYFAYMKNNLGQKRTYYKS